MACAMTVAPGRSTAFALAARTAQTAVRVPRMNVAPPVAGAAAEEVRAAQALEEVLRVARQEVPLAVPLVEAHQAAVLPLLRVG